MTNLAIWNISRNNRIKYYVIAAKLIQEEIVVNLGICKQNEKCVTVIHMKTVRMCFLEYNLNTKLHLK